MSIIHKGNKIASTNVTGDTLPIGAMIPFPNDTIPYGWLLCNGQAVSRIDYADLFAVLGTSHGVGDGTTTFNVPDMRDYTVVGKSSTDTNIDTIGKKYGAKTHVLTVAQLATHKHNIRSNVTAGGTSAAATLTIGTAYSSSDANVAFDAGGNEAHNNMQPSIAENYIIKAKQSSGVVATVVDDLESTSTVDALSANQGRILNEKMVDVTLWTNSNPTYDFEPQNINISNLKNYKRIGIVFKYWKSDPQVIYQEFLTKYESHKILGAYDYNAERRINIYDNKLNIENATVTIPPACDYTVQNGRLVPVEIIGYYF